MHNISSRMVLSGAKGLTTRYVTPPVTTWLPPTDMGEMSSRPTTSFPLPAQLHPTMSNYMAKVWPKYDFKPKARSAI